MATPKVSRSWAAVAAPRLMACLICRSVTALHTHTYISMRTPHVSSDKNNSANKNRLQQFYEKNISRKISKLEKCGKKVCAGVARWGQAGRDLLLRGRGRWAGAGRARAAAGAGLAAVPAGRRGAGGVWRGR